MTQKPEFPRPLPQQVAQLVQTDELDPDVDDISEASTASRRLTRRGLTTQRAELRLQFDSDVLTWLQDRGSADQAHIDGILRDQMRADREDRKWM